MRILMVAQFYVPIVGGEERVVETLSTALARRGHQVALATLWHPDLPEEEVVDGVRVYRLHSTMERLAGAFRDPERRHAPPAPDPGAARALARIVECERPDVVHAHNWLVHSLPRRLGVPLVLSLHDFSLVCANKRLMRGDARCDGPGLVKCLACATRQYGVKGVPTALALRIDGRRLRGRIDMLLPVSEAVARGSGLPAQARPYEVIPNFLPDRLFLTEPGVVGHEGLPPDGFVLFVGDLSQDKGVDVLLEAHAGIRDAPPLVLIGRLRSSALREAPPNVVVLGPRRHEVALSALRRCSVAVVPSVCREAFGLAALEAMAMGRPVVAARSGGLPELIAHEETGLLTPPGDATALRVALERMLSDPALRERLGAAARRRAEAFREAAVVPRVERVYQRLIDPSGGGEGAAVGRLGAKASPALRR